MLDQSACCPSPCDNRLPSCSFVGDHVFASIRKLVVRVVGIVKDVQVPWVQEIAIWRITEVNNSTFFSLVVHIKNLHTLVTVIASPHPAHAIQCHIAVRCRFGLMIPMRARIFIIVEVSGEPIGFLGCWWCMASYCLIADVCSRGVQVLLDDLEGCCKRGREQAQQCEFHEYLSI